jgi:hypothetical protein
MSLAESELIAASLITLGIVFYAVFRWRAAPAAFRAILAVSLSGFAAGAVASLAVVQLWSGSPLVLGATGGRVQALEVGKAIVLTNERHAGDPLWMPISAVERECREKTGGPPPLFKETSLECRAAYLAMHALGKDLDKGPHEKWIDLEEIADICEAGAVEKDSSLCRRAFAARNATMK